MSVTLAAIVLAVLFLAYSNGANDNLKGVATLLGSGTTDYRRARAWATVTTLAGSLLALTLAQGLVEAFRGKGLVPDTVTARTDFRLAVSLAAALTILLATQAGLPVSTTHALIGGLVGAGTLAATEDMRLRVLGTAFVLPLVFSPVIAMLLTVVVSPVFRLARRASGVSDQAEMAAIKVHAGAESRGDALATGDAITDARADEARGERARDAGQALGREVGPVIDALHYLSGGAVGFARGLNDTPKIVALMLAGDAFHPNLGLAAAATFMALGGVLNAHRVAETMSRKITRMSPGQGLAANLVTALLVTTASRWGLPVSTTHVAVGALFGIGTVTGMAQARTILAILLAWTTTLPIAAALAAGVYLALRACAPGG
jgi:PiT family inorganic phosphate transporter